MRGLFDQLATDGWNGIDVDPARFNADMEAMALEALNEALPVAELFATPAGQQVLLWLMQKTILRPPSDEERCAKSAEEFAILKARRDGQNGVIFMILQALQVAEGGKAAGQMKPD